ncbi:hypothetical protein ACHAXT_011786 [Thalassiosira profunda]
MSRVAAVKSAAAPIFVDYVPPDQPPDVRPPARYKLSFIVYCHNVVADIFADKAGLRDFLTFGGWFSPGLALFLQVAIIVCTLVFGTLDAFTRIFTFERRGKLYGVGAWLKRDRSTWLLRYSNVFAETLLCIVRILEDGFAMFNAPKNNKPEESRLFQCGNRQPVELRVEHGIDPAKMDEYEQWVQRVEEVSSRYAHGLISVTRNYEQHISVRSGQSEGDSNGGGASRDIESLGVSADADLDGAVLISTTLRFEDIDALNEWMVSPRRKVLMADLKGMLVVPNAELIRLSRDLPDAFTDLLSLQGRPVPREPPKKWKVWWIAVISRFIAIHWVAAMLNYYFQFWGMDDPSLQRLVSVAASVFLNSYILLPLLSRLFEPWMRRKRHEKVETKEPWKTLNEGFGSLWWKCLLTLTYFGGCFVAWMVKA